MSRPVIFGVNPRDKACGIAQFGLNLEAVLKHSARYDYQFREPVTEVEYRMLLDEYQPAFVLWNYYPCVMPWMNLHVLNMARERGIRQASIFHEVPVTGFDALIYPDPTFTTKSENLVDWFPIGRPIPRIWQVPARTVDLKHPIIGSSGFGFENKGYVRLVERVNEEFEHATIRFHLPYARWGDEHGERARRVAEWCRSAAKPSIKLEFSHDFKTPDDYIEWLAGNDLNAFLYDEMPGRGIASTIDFALMANRPIAVTKTTMFRHLHSVYPSVCVEDRTLMEILISGVSPLMKLQLEFSPEHICAQMDFIVDSVMLPQKRCRLLRDSDREHLQPMIAKMYEKLPEMMARKIPAANVQQAWVLRAVTDTKASHALCVGCFEDTAYHTLQAHGFDVEGIDSALDMDLAKYRRKVGLQFPCVFATSVIEHVPDDAQFIRDLCDCLVPGGTCILTADFKEGWKKGQPLPATDQRFYTSADIARIGKILTEKGCYFVDKPDTSGAPDFHYQGHDYSFIGLIFKKL